MRNERVISLIIVIFIIMLLGMMGWTLAVMQATDFDANTRVHDSEKALYLAETGLNYCYNQLINDSTWHTGPVFDNDCTDVGDWVTHNLTGGQYRFCCRAPLASESGMGNIALQAEGYVPSYANYRTMRAVKVLIRLGAFTNTCQVRGILDWTGWSSNSYIRGDIAANRYEGNGNGIYNENTIDYLDGTNGELPRGDNFDNRTIGADPFPTINMDFYEATSQASHELWVPPLSAKITAVQTNVSPPTTDITVDPALFPAASSWSVHALRNTRRGHCAAGRVATINSRLSDAMVRVDGIQDWVVGERVNVAVKPQTVTWNNGTKTYTLTFLPNVFSSPLSNWNGMALRRLIYRQDSTGTVYYPQWEFQNWGVLTVTSATQCTVAMDSTVNPLAGDPVTNWNVSGYTPWFVVARRFSANDNNRGAVMYDCSDSLMDVRNNDVNFYNTGLVSEGDVVIKGTRAIYFDRRPLIYPNVATQYGNIYSDEPGGNNDNQKLGRRNFDDIWYTQFGDVSATYLSAKAIYAGGNCTLRGLIQLQYERQLKRLEGFEWSFANMHWQEQ
jgi:hypothetical protein